MRLISDETDFKEIRHQKYQLYYKNVRVEDVQYYLHSKKKRLNVADGRIVENIDIDISKPMPESKALDFALTDQKLSADLFKGKDKLPKGELIIARIGEDFVQSNYRYCYAFDIENEGIDAPKGALAEPYRIYVDAASGAVVRRYPLRHQCFGGSSHSTHDTDAPVIRPEKLANTVNAPLVASNFTPLWGGRYGGNQVFETEPFGGQYRLSHQNGALITRRDVNRTGEWASNPDIFNPSTAWGTNSQNATTAHWLTQRVHTFVQTFAPDQNGYNRQGAYPRILVDLTIGTVPQVDAYWDRNGQIKFGFAPFPSSIVGDFRANTSRALLTADILGHEYMHAVTQNTVPGDLTYYGESGALNEAISDIMGTAFERFMFPSNWNWNLGEDSYQVRDMANPRRAFLPFPPSNGQPIRYLDTQNGWQNTSDPTDRGGVHVNSGVMNKWFHTLCTGEFPVGQRVMNPISFDEAINIVYRMVRYYLQSGSGYPNIRDATAAAARDLYGGCSPQERAVIEA